MQEHEVRLTLRTILEDEGSRRMINAIKILYVQNIGRSSALDISESRYWISVIDPEVAMVC